MARILYKSTLSAHHLLLSPDEAVELALWFQAIEEKDTPRPDG